MDNILRKSVFKASTVIAVLFALAGCTEGSLNRDLRLWQYYRVVGDTRLAAKQMPAAESAYLNALKLANELHNNLRIAISYKRLALVCVTKGSWDRGAANYQSAIKSFQAALEAAEAPAEKVMIEEEVLECFLLLGDLKATQKEYKGAEQFYRVAIDGYETLALRKPQKLDFSILFRWSQATQSLVKLLKTTGREAECRTIVDRFFSRSKDTGVPRTITDNLENELVAGGTNTGASTRVTGTRGSIEASRNWILSYTTGREYMYKRRDYDNAELYFRKAIAQAQSLPRLDAREGLAWKELGMVFSARQDDQNAINFLRKGLTILKQTSTKSNTDWLDAEFGLVAILNRSGKYEEAAKQGEILTEDLVAIESPNSPRVAAAAKDVGFMYATIKNWTMAEKYFARADNVYRNNPDCPPGEQALVLANLALAQVNLNKLPAAKSNIDKAITYLQQPGATQESRRLVGDLYRLLEKRLKRK